MEDFPKHFVGLLKSEATRPKREKENFKGGGKE